MGVAVRNVSCRPSHASKEGPMRRSLLFSLLLGGAALASAPEWLALTAKVGGAAMPALPAEICSRETPFMAENQAAMSKMMDGMNIQPSDDVDRDFSAMMIPHHQGAIDMAKAELLYGRDPVMRRLAQEILVDQQSEIDAMQLRLEKTALSNSKRK
jgi:hypothetical protein